MSGTEPSCNGRSLVTFCLLAFLAGTPCFAQEAPSEEPIVDVAWIVGPSTAELGEVAKIDVPDGFVFANADDTRKLMESMQNTTNGLEMGFLAPSEENWFVIFEYEQIGYVKDEDKDELDADAILKSITEATNESNKIRREKGWDTLTVLGWIQPPHYDEQTHNLEWATKAQSGKGDLYSNYNARILGRRGVMHSTLVCDPENIEKTLAEYKQILTGYKFQSGEKYAEFKSGDKIAKYGLLALITGGAAVVAAKTGLLRHLWKILLVAGAAVVAFFKKIFGKLRKGRSASTKPVEPMHGESSEENEAGESEQWECPKCNHQNPASLFVCEKCQYRPV